LVTGDFNIDPIRDGNIKSGRYLEDWSINHDLIQLVQTKTRKRIVLRNNDAYLQESMIDLAYTNRPSEADSLVFDNDFSDHGMIWTKIRYGTSMKKQ